MVSADELRVSVAQIGARMHYAVPRIMESAGVLQCFHTDICATKGVPRYVRRVMPRKWMPTSVEGLFDRIPHGVPPSKTKTYPFFGIRFALRSYLRDARSEKTRDYLWGGTRFANLVSENLSERLNAVFTFKLTALEILEECSERGVFTILEQPNVHRPVMHRLLREEYDRFEGWAEAPADNEFLDSEAGREREEWEKADLIVCPSKFVQSGVQEGGGPVDRTVIIPYGVDISPRSVPKTLEVGTQINVLTVGTMGLRKGAPYLMRAAKLSDACFRAVGSVNLRPHGEELLREHVDLAGHVPRSQIHEQYEWADVFVLPSICEGSATVVYEALAHGLPVICTPNTGAIIRDGREGFIVPVRDAASIAERLDRLASDPDLYRALSQNALTRYKEEGSLEAYGQNLISSIRRAFSEK